MDRRIKNQIEDMIREELLLPLFRSYFDKKIFQECSLQDILITRPSDTPDIKFARDVVDFYDTLTSEVSKNIPEVIRIGEVDLDEIEENFKYGYRTHLLLSFAAIRKLFEFKKSQYQLKLLSNQLKNKKYLFDSYRNSINALQSWGYLKSGGEEQRDRIEKILGNFNLSQFDNLLKSIDETETNLKDSVVLFKFFNAVPLSAIATTLAGSAFIIKALIEKYVSGTNPALSISMPDILFYIGYGMLYVIVLCGGIILWEELKFRFRF
jgi:hypothetical protein